MAYIYDLTDTWNAGGTTFYGIKMNVTNTASASGSKLLSLQVGGSEQFGVDKNGTGYFTGNVGIGLVASVKLDVNAGSLGGTAGNSLDLYRVLGYASNLRSLTARLIRNTTGSDWTGTTMRLQNTIDVTNSAYIDFSPNGTHDLALGTGSSPAERVRIDSNGNVGIGTSSATARLRVAAAGQVNAPALGNVTNYPAFFSNNDSGYGLGIGTNATDGHVWLQAQRSDTATAYNLTINEAGGNVGIGTTTPGYALDVVGDFRATTDIVGGATIATGNGISTGDVVIELGGLRTGSGNCYIDLHATNGTDFEARVLRNSGVNGAFDVFNTGTGVFNISQVGAAPLIFKTTDAERMRITAAGNLQLGTASLATNAADGFPYIPTCAGTPTGTPTAITGYAPMVVDSTNNKLYVYVGGAWQAMN